MGGSALAVKGQPRVCRWKAATTLPTLGSNPYIYHGYHYPGCSALAVDASSHDADTKLKV